MSCALLGAERLMHHAEQRLGIKAGGTTADGVFSLHSAECRAACTEAPCLQVNYRYRYSASRPSSSTLSSMTSPLVPSTARSRHGTLATVRQPSPTAPPAPSILTPARCLRLRVTHVEHQA